MISWHIKHQIITLSQIQWSFRIFFRHLGCCCNWCHRKVRSRSADHCPRNPQKRHSLTHCPHPVCSYRSRQDILRLEDCAWSEGRWRWLRSLRRGRIIKIITVGIVEVRILPRVMDLLRLHWDLRLMRQCSIGDGEGIPYEMTWDSWYLGVGDICTNLIYGILVASYMLYLSFPRGWNRG